MRAAVVKAFGAPLVLEDRPTPDPGRGEIRVKIETSGVCHTDIHAAHGDWPVKPALPLVPGHEGVGIVDALGDGVTRVRLGQRVAIPWLGGADGTCEYCVKGLETYCVAPTFTGYTVDGGYREYSIANANFVGIVPDEVDPLDAAPLTCAGVTTYKAVKLSGARSSDVVAVFGAGGLGHLALQYGRITGAAVVAVDVSAARLENAGELGAEHLIHAGEEDPVAAIKRLGGADAAISTAATPVAIEQAFASLARGGKLVMVGLPKDNEIKIPVFETVLNGLTIIGSIVGTHHDLEEVFELHRRGLTRVQRTQRALDDVNDAIEQVLDGSAPAPRMVFDMSETGDQAAARPAATAPAGA